MHDTKMTEPTDRLKIRESIDRDKMIWERVFGPTAGNTDNNVSGFEFHKDEKLEYQHALMKSHISFALFYLEHSVSDPLLSDEQIYDLWQEKSRER